MAVNHNIYSHNARLLTDNVLRAEVHYNKIKFKYAI